MQKEQISKKPELEQQRLKKLCGASFKVVRKEQKIEIMTNSTY